MFGKCGNLLRGTVSMLIGSVYSWLSSALVVLLSVVGTLLLAASPSAREMIIIYECGATESLAKSLMEGAEVCNQPAGLGAASGMLLTALYQEAAPIIVPVPLWQTIVEHKRVFDDFVTLDYAELTKKYACRARFKGQDTCASFQDCCRYLDRLYKRFSEFVRLSDAKQQQLEKLIRLDPLFDKSSAPPALQNLASPLWQELWLYLICSYVPLERYFLKRIIHPLHQKAPFYLFIPHSYRAHCLKERTVIDWRDDRISHEEYVLGIMHEQYPFVMQPFSLEPLSSDSVQAYHDSFLPLMRELFITKERFPAHVAGEWIFYMIGHGSFDQEAPARIAHEKKALESCYRDLRTLVKQKKAWQAKTGDLKKVLDRQGKNYDTYVAESYIRAQSNVQLCQENIKKCLGNIQVTKSNIALLNSANNIAGLSRGQFTKFLRFLDRLLMTRLFFYSSCSAGGQHFLDAYWDPRHHQPLTLSFTVVADVLTEAPSLLVAPRILLSYYQDRLQGQFFDIPYSALVDPQRQALAIDSPYKLRLFFDRAGCEPVTAGSLKDLLGCCSPLLVSKQPLEDAQVFTCSWKAYCQTAWRVVCRWFEKVFFRVPRAHRPLKREHVRNIPSIRLPFATSFRVIDVQGSFFSLSRWQAGTQGALITVPGDTDVIFLDWQNIAGTLALAPLERRTCLRLYDTRQGCAYSCQY